MGILDYLTEKFDNLNFLAPNSISPRSSSKPKSAPLNKFESWVKSQEKDLYRKPGSAGH